MLVRYTICYLSSTMIFGAYCVGKIHNIGLGAKLIYMGYFASLLHPPGRKTWLLFSVRDMFWGLRNPCFSRISVVSFL